MGRLERATRRAFGATMFNWSCYMNLSYRNDPPDPHVHWWMAPRYRDSVILNGVKFDDPEFASPYSHQRWREVSETTRAEIVAALRAALAALD